MSSNNKKIAINTGIIYLRLIITTIVSLLTTRYVLQILGAADYGLFNIVGSVITMLNCISTAMYTTTRRYINIEMGKPNGNLNKIFNISLILHLGFALLILLICESVGVWYINNYLNVAPEKLNDAHFIFQITTIVSCIGIMNVPYQGLIEAFEKFWQTAIIDIINTILKFVIVLILIFYTGDNVLRVYAVMLSLLTLFSFILYQMACHKQWKEIVKLRFYSDKSLYKDILVFNNYTALGAIAFLARTQGSNILVNFFFGTIINAAFAIAYQIQNFVQLFVGNLGAASAPQITQNFSKGNITEAFNLCSRINRYTILIMTIIYSTLSIRIEYILTLWLGEIPEGTIVLCLWILKYALCHSFLACISTYIQASGKIKWFQITGIILELSLLPIGYVFFEIGHPPVTIFKILTTIIAINIFVNLSLMKIILNFKSILFVLNSYVRPLLVILTMNLWFFIANRCLITHSIVIILITFILSIIIVIAIGINRKEQQTLKYTIFNYIDIIKRK